MTLRIGSKRGLTLIELLISVAILAGAVVLIMQAFARGASALAFAKHRMRAFQFASAKLVEAELAAAAGKTPDLKGSFRVGRDRFEWHLAAEPAFDEPELELLTLTVDWRQGRTPYDLHLSTLKRVIIVPE
jgi:prepilin-type N-terminal cleavage/methylation domain-containing protein